MRIWQIGDGESDLALAEKIGCRFIGVKNEWNEWTTNTVSFSLITHVKELPDIL